MDSRKMEIAAHNSADEGRMVLFLMDPIITRVKIIPATNKMIFSLMPISHQIIRI